MQRVPPRTRPHSLLPCWRQRPRWQQQTVRTSTGRTEFPCRTVHRRLLVRDAGTDFGASSGGGSQRRRRPLRFCKLQLLHQLRGVLQRLVRRRAARSAADGNHAQLPRPCPNRRLSQAATATAKECGCTPTETPVGSQNQNLPTVARERQGLVVMHRALRHLPRTKHSGPGPLCQTLPLHLERQTAHGYFQGCPGLVMLRKRR